MVVRPGIDSFPSVLWWRILLTFSRFSQTYDLRIITFFRPVSRNQF